MRIIELTREAVEPIKPLPILPQGNQTPPPAKPAPAPAAAKPAPANSGAAAGPAAFGGGMVNPPSKSGVVSKAELDNYRRDSGNPNATLGQYMNQQQGLTARKGGANDPAVIAARQQTAGPRVGSQAQTASGANELAKTRIAAGSPALAQPPASTPNSGSSYTGPIGNADNNPAPTEPAAAAPGQRPGGIAFNQDAGASPAAAPAPAADPTAAVNPMTGYSNSGGNKGGAGPSYAGQGGNQTTAAAAPPADATNASGYTNPGGVGNVADFGVRGTPILPYGQGSPVKGTTNAVTRTDAEIGDKGVPGSFDKNRAQGEKNLQSLKNFFGGNKQTAAPAAAPIPPANPMRGVRESSSSQDPVLVRMQNLAGIRR